MHALDDRMVAVTNGVPGAASTSSSIIATGTVNVAAAVGTSVGAALTMGYIGSTATPGITVSC